MMNSKVKMPSLFIGHGSPMNAIENNVYTGNWMKTAARIPKPDAILAVSAHWYTHGTRIMEEEHPRMIYDMYGFSDELYRISYPAKGSTELSLLTKGLISKKVETDNSWGYDHGTWSVLCRMYPEADIPVYQLSVDMDADAETQYETGRELRSLREQGVLILGSGNVVHNLSKIGWGMTGGYSWAEEFDEYIKGKIATGKFQDVIHYETAGKCAEIAFHTPEHFYPLLHVLGASCEDDRLTVFNDSCVMGSLSMTCYLFE